MFKFIQNIGDYFSGNYFDEDFTSKVLSRTGYSSDDIKEFNKKISPLKDRYFRYKQLYIEGKLRTKDKIFETHNFHTELLNALGYNGNINQYNNLFHLNEHDVIPVRHILHRGDQAHLMIMEMQALIKEDENEPDGLFEQSYNVEDETQTYPPQRYHRLQWERVFTVPDDVKISPTIINKIISELFLIEQHLRPKYILLLAGNVIFLLEQEKWFRGSYLKIDLEELFSEATANRNANYYALFYFLIGKETLSPDSNIILLDQLDEDSHKSAYEVTKDLKEGIIYAIEALANETLFYQKNILKEEFDETDDQFEKEIKDDCLTVIYRMLFIFYAESRQDLDILPINDAIYSRGYSLEMLRDLEQVPLYSETSLNGYFFHESLSQLFQLLSSGYREKENGQNKSFKVRLIDSPLFDNRKLHHLHKVKFRNKVWQDIICRLSLSKQQRGRSRGRITYANLGINQLGSAYESLLAYRGFYAEQDYIEVHKAGKPEEGTFLVPRIRRDDFEEDEVLKNEDGYDVILKKGSFVYRLSGRDRQKSASYYTPEVLTQCVVKYTLKQILGKLDKKEIRAIELLELKLLEPAMGASAFQNEMINQLAEAYLNYRQDELNKKVAPDHYKEELHKVKAYIATNNTYGVDLNPTAIELGKLSLWLNVIHHEMETPFFSNRLALGNAVVGAWLNVYKEIDISEGYEVIKGSKGKDKRVLQKKEWWNSAPRQLKFKPNPDHDRIRHGRKSDEIYHFLLFDKNMVPSSGISFLKKDNEALLKRISDDRKNWCKPISKTELDQLKRICNKIDELLAEYYRFQKTINLQTSNKHNIFGAYKTNEQASIEMRSYDEKEKLADQRNRHNAPYFKLKMVMDYWCSLWFWDMRQAVNLPDRLQYWQDITLILELDIDKSLDGIIEKKGQQKLFETTFQLSMAMEPGKSSDEQQIFTDVAVEYTQRKDLFDKNERLQIVNHLAQLYHFFHPQLEFLEVFWERGGFDLIAGNPPWVAILSDETGMLSEIQPESVLRGNTAPQVKKIVEEEIKINSEFKALVFNELIASESMQYFIGSTQNFPLLVGLRNNLYKCILVNCLNLTNSNGVVGLLHPEGVYDDPVAVKLRGYLYKKLLYHFEFKNSLFLFAEVHDQKNYSINIYSKEKEHPLFESINNLFHPSTIDLCFIHDNSGIVDGLKIKDERTQKFTWNLRPHKKRIIKYSQDELLILSQTFENSNNWETTKLPAIHSNEILSVLQKLGRFESKCEQFDYYLTMCWDEVGSINKNIIKEGVKFPEINEYEYIFKGPHFFVSNPGYKTPRTNCHQNSDYDNINLVLTNENFISRSNFLPSDNFMAEISKNDDFSKFINSYKVSFSRRLNVASERTLQPALMLPKSSHINSVISTTFKNEKDLIELCGICSSIILDFYIKVVGRGDLYDISSFPLGIEERYKKLLLVRTLRLNCINNYYSEFWERNYEKDYSNDNWSKADSRLNTYNQLSKFWDQNVTLKTHFERRQALVEIDVITAFSLGLSIEELILLYKVQFPVLQQNEDDTWYDIKGNIVFTASAGLVGVGVDRSVWDQICNFQPGETYMHTITKSELYNGKQIIYYAPFEKCDRVEDYRVTWRHFEKVFNQNLE
jgi:hypothetical protein